MAYSFKKLLIITINLSVVICYSEALSLLRSLDFCPVIPPPPPDISRSVRTERPGNYIFKIESFSLLGRALEKTGRHKYDSCHFEAGGSKWKLSVYPNGDKKRGGDGHISLYLALAEPESLPLGKEVHVIFKFFVYDYLRDNYLVLQDGIERRFHEFNTEWGFAKLLSLETFKDPSQGYLVDDCCVFGVEMFFHTNAIKGRSSLSIIKHSPWGLQDIFTWKIDNFSTSGMHESDVFSLGGCKWTLIFYLEGNSRVKGKSVSLFLSVHDRSSLHGGWSIDLEDKLSILSQTNDGHHLRTRGWGWFMFTDFEPVLGYADFMSISDFKDPSRGFVVNDTVIIQVQILSILVVKNLP